MADAAEVLKNALALGVEDRAVLAERLFASLDDLEEAEAERLWAAEAQRRLDGYREGSARAVEAHQVAEKVGRLLR
jgi:putative addiction module component (TIGR02574 family)